MAAPARVRPRLLPSTEAVCTSTEQDMSVLVWRRAKYVGVSLGLALLASSAYGQYNERPGTVGSGIPGVDASGRSIKNKRVRAVHTTDPDLAGGTAYLIRKDPFLAYQLGRNLNFREFRTRDGVFAVVSNLGGPMPDGTTAKITANNHVSCSGCHNLPQGNAGGGVTFHKDSGFGRNTPHYYGAGITEMLAIQIRTEILLQIDTNGDGWVSAAESAAAPGSVTVVPSPGANAIDYGDPRLDHGLTGTPGLNNIFRVWYVDAAGQVVEGATEVDGVTTHGYNFNMIVWGWGQGGGRAALNPTNRAFLWDPYVAHSGLDSHDPSTLNDPDGDGVSLPTLVGAVQFPATHQAPDAGNTLDPLGFSRDDPDGDGYLTEISEGDLDLAEWFMLNHPRPGFAASGNNYARGVAIMDSLGCTECHVTNWEIYPQDANYAGDRRLFDYETTWKPNKKEFQGKLVKLYTQQGDELIPQRAGFMVQGIFTDFRHHYMGPDFEELDFGGTINDIWRTAPLWGAGSGFPWGHDGQSLTLEDVILRHGGEAENSRIAYENATNVTKNTLLRFLNRLRLYDVETTPADIEGDGMVRQNFMVAGRLTGFERFNAEWLFQVPGQVQGRAQNAEGIPIQSWALINVDDAYGQLLPYRIDSDDDGWPDVWDHAPNSTGYLDGVN